MHDSTMAMIQTILTVEGTPSSRVASMVSRAEECLMDSLVEASPAVDSLEGDSLEGDSRVEASTSNSRRLLLTEWDHTRHITGSSFIMYLSPHFNMYVASTAVEGCLEYTRLVSASNTCGYGRKHHC